jgi:hypothetical protein
MNQFDQKEIVPIMSGNTRYLGLSVPEWAIQGFLFTTYFGLFHHWFIALIIHVVLIIIYVAFLSKLEENIIFVLISSFKIPSIIYGKFISKRIIKK